VSLLLANSTGTTTVTATASNTTQGSCSITRTP
jgi:hypothetical protein